MRGVVVFLLFVILLIGSTTAQEEEPPTQLECIKGSVISYSYFSVTENVRGGERGSERASQFQEKTTIRCKVELECVELFQNKHDASKVAYLYAANFTQVQMFQQNKQHPLDPAFFIGAPNQRKASIPFDPHYNVGKQMDKEFNFPFAYSMSRNGKLLRVYHHQKEAPWVTQIKKSIINNLETKLSGSERLEYSPNGITQSHYKQKLNSKNELVVKKQSKENDIVQTPKGSSSEKESGNESHLKHIRESSKSTQKITPSGLVRVAKVKQSVVIGGKPHDKHTHDAFKAQRHNHEYRDSLNGDMKNPIRESAKVRMVLLHVRPKSKQSTDSKESLSSVIKPLDWDHIGNDFELKASENVQSLFEDKYTNWKYTSLTLKHDENHDDEVPVLRITSKKEAQVKKMKGNIPQLLLHPEMVESTAMADISLYLFAKNVVSERLFQKFDFLKELRKMKRQQSDLVPLSRLGLYCKHKQNSLTVLEKEFAIALEELQETRGKETESLLLNYLKMLQALIASISTKKAQKVLLTTIDRVLENALLTPSHVLTLLEHAMHRMPNFDHPSHTLIGYLNAFQNVFLKPSSNVTITEDEQRHLNQLQLDAYMIFAAVAPKHSGHRIGVVQQIIDNIKYAKSAFEKEFHMNALYNAGEHVPIPILEYIIFEEDGLFNSIEKSIAVRSLTKKMLVTEHDAVHNLIARIIKAKRVSAEVKAVAIATQMIRERKMHNTGHLIHHFAKLYSNSTNATAPIVKEALEEYFHEEGSHEAGEALFFRLQSQQGLEEEENDDEDVSVLSVKNKIKDMFAKAEFDGVPKGYVASQMGDTFTLYDREMQKFFDERNNYMAFKDNNFARHFAFERIIGVKVANFYFGVAGYAGSRCEDAEVKSDFQFQFLAKGVARAELFRARLTLFNAEFAFAKVKGKPLDQRMFLSILGISFNRRFYEDPAADSLNYCDRKPNRINLFEKHFDKIFSATFTFVLGYIPLMIEIKMFATIGVDFGYYYCPRNMVTKFSIEPYIVTGPVIDVGIGIPLLAAGVSIKISVSYRLIPYISAEKCSLCVGLDHEIEPFALTAGLWIRLLIFTFRVNLFTIKAPTIRGSLFKRCVDGEAMVNAIFVKDTFHLRNGWCILQEQVNRHSNIKRQIKETKKVIKRKPGVLLEISTYEKLLADKRNQRRATIEMTQKAQEKQIIASTKLMPEAIVNFYIKAKEEIDMVSQIHWGLEMNLLSLEYKWPSIATFYLKLIEAMKQDRIKELFLEEYTAEFLAEEFSSKVQQASIYGNQLTHNDFIKIYSIRITLKRLAKQLKHDKNKRDLIFVLAQEPTQLSSLLEKLYKKWIVFKPMKALLDGFMDIWQRDVPLYVKKQFLKKVSERYGKERYLKERKDNEDYINALKLGTTVPIFKKRYIERTAMQLQKNLAFQIQANDLKGVTDFYESFLQFERHFRLYFLKRATQMVESEYYQTIQSNPMLTEEEFYKSKELQAIQSSIEVPLDLIEDEERKSKFIVTTAEEVFDQEQKFREEDLKEVLKHEADIKAEDDIYFTKMDQIKKAYENEERQHVELLINSYKHACYDEIQYVEKCMITSQYTKYSVQAVSDCYRKRERNIMRFQDQVKKLHKTIQFRPKQFRPKRRR